MERRTKTKELWNHLVYYKELHNIGRPAFIYSEKIDKIYTNRLFSTHFELSHEKINRHFSLQQFLNRREFKTLFHNNLQEKQQLVINGQMYDCQINMLQPKSVYLVEFN